MVLYHTHLGWVTMGALVTSMLLMLCFIYSVCPYGARGIIHLLWTQEMLIYFLSKGYPPFYESYVSQDISSAGASKPRFKMEACNG